MGDDEVPTIVQRLRFIQHQHGWSATEMARQAGLPRRSMENYLKGHKPGYDALIAMARAFSTPLDWLCGAMDEAPGHLESVVYEAAFPTIIRIVDRLRYYSQETDQNPFKGGLIFGRPLKDYTDEETKSVVGRFSAIRAEYPEGKGP